MKLLYRICVCALLTALAGVALSAILLLRTATAVIAALPPELAATRAALLAEVHSSRLEVLRRSDRQLTALRHDLLDETRQFRETADRRAGDTLSRADSALATIDSLRGDLQPLLASAQSTLDDTHKTVSDLHPQLLGLVAASKITAGETAQTMRDVRNAVPSFISQTQSIAGNVNLTTLRFSDVAGNLNRLTKPKWYDRLIGYGLNGVVIYRNLNPVTNLTLKGAQILSSRP